MPYEFRASVDSNIEHIEVFNRRLVDILSKVIDSDEQLFDIRLILNELIINGALHGNGCDEKKFVSVSVYVGDSAIRICVKDQGDGIHCLWPLKRESDMMGGRGLGIVGSLVDEMEACYNRITCVKYL